MLTPTQTQTAATSGTVNVLSRKGLSPLAAPKTPTTPGATASATAPKTPDSGLTAGLAPQSWRQAVPDQINDSVADKVRDLTSQDSPLMQQARTDGLKVASRRGLLNSSMAAGASQDAMLRAATPIASQDAAQAAQKNLQAKDFEFGMEKQADQQGWQSNENGLDRTLQSDLAKAQRELDLLMQSNDISSREQMQIRDIGSREGMAAADRALQQLMQGRDITSREGLAAAERQLQSSMQSKDIAARSDLADNERKNQQLMQDREIAYQNANRNLDRGLQEKLASWNLKSADRNAAAQFLTNMEASYQDSYNSIMANTALDAGTRTAQLASAKALRDKNLSFVEQMYVIDLTW